MTDPGILRKLLQILLSLICIVHEFGWDPICIIVSLSCILPLLSQSFLLTFESPISIVYFTYRPMPSLALGKTRKSILPSSIYICTGTMASVHLNVNAHSISTWSYLHVYTIVWSELCRYTRVQSLQRQCSLYLIIYACDSNTMLYGTT